MPSEYEEDTTQIVCTYFSEKNQRLHKLNKYTKN